MVDGTHLLVQAGTGTGKSLAYLVPALLHDSRVVVATATLALQHQLVERDLPRLVEAVGDLPGVDASYAVLKGRSNYACLHRIRAGVPDDQGALVEVPQGSMATKVLELRAWAEEEVEGKGSGERDNAPRHTDREWRQVSVNHRECLGASKCPFGQECFAELAREKAQRSHLDRHQPLAARDRRDRGRADDPRLRRRGRRRGARAGRPDHPGRHRRAVRGRRRPGGQAVAATRRGQRGRRPRRRRRRAARRHRRPRPRPDRHAARRARRRPGLRADARAGLPVGLPQGRQRRARRRRRRAQPGQGDGAGGVRRPPSGWPRTPRATCSG